MKINKIKKSLNLLLPSSSRPYRQKYFSHCANEIKALFFGVKRVLFVPYGDYNQVGYGIEVRARFKALNFAVDVLPEGETAVAMIKNAQAIYVGGGNTFRLLFKLRKSGLVKPMRERILAGVPYLGPSAGAILACPTIQTTNTIATLWPSKPEALNLIPFYINPHYTPTNPATHLSGETKEERIEEFLEENNKTVIALGESSFLRVKNGKVLLGGSSPAFIFRRGVQPVRYNPPAKLGPALAS